MFKSELHVEEILCNQLSTFLKGEMFCGKESSRNYDRHG